MPVDWDRVDALRQAKYNARHGGKGGVARFEADLRDAAARLPGSRPLTFGSYRNRMEGARGLRSRGSLSADRIYLDQVEQLALVLGVSVTEILTGESRDEAYEQGFRAGRSHAFGEVHNFTSRALQE
jgi:hypothetical protein